MVLAAGATADRISYGNTIKKERDIARAFALGVRLFAVDCVEEVEKIARAAPGASVFCRILCDGDGAEWPLSRKFGCVPAMASSVLEHAHRSGLDRLWRLVPRRLAADQPEGLGQGAESAAAVFRTLAERGITLSHGQSRRRLPGALPEGRAGGEALRRARSSGRCASTSATASRRRSSSRAAAWSAMPA